MNNDFFHPIMTYLIDISHDIIGVDVFQPVLFKRRQFKNAHDPY